MSEQQAEWLRISCEGREALVKASADCFGCTEGQGWNEPCPASRRECRHHCNHDNCHWCGTGCDDDGMTTGPDFERSVLIEEPNPYTDKPTGMCGSSKVCARCPSHFICSVKAGDELNRIKAERPMTTRPDVVSAARVGTSDPVEAEQ